MSVAMQLDWSLGDRMAKARRYAGLEQAELAEKVGVSRALVSKWERDVSEPSATQIARWATECGVDVRWLITTCFGPFPAPMTPGQMELALGWFPERHLAVAR